MDEEVISPQSPESLLAFDRESLTPHHGETEVPLTPRYKTFKKLEVMSAREINFVSGIYHIVSFVALLASVTVTILARTTFSEPFSLGDLVPELILYYFPGYFALVDSILSFVLFGGATIILIVYSVIVLLESRKEGKKLLHEQMWVFVLLVASFFYFMPYEAAVRLRTDFLDKPAPDTSSPWSYAFVCLKVTSFSVIYILYLWMGAHGYRYLERRVSFQDVMFYVPKIGAVAVYVLYKLCILFIYQITFSEMPFATFVAFLNLYGTIGEWPRLGVITVVILTLMEIGLLGMVLFDIFRTSRRLRRAEYSKNRTKILGFRFFLHQHVVFSTIYTLTYVVLLFGLPNGIQAFQFILHSINEDGTKGDSNGRGSYFDVQYSPFGLLLCVLSFVSIEAYTNLPASASIRTFLLPCIHKVDEENRIEPEPVVYRNREPPSFSSVMDEQELDLRPSCFVMQTNVELFNFAWFVYYHGTKKEKSLKVDFKAINVSIRDSLYDKDTDTRVIVAETHDRIIYAFKGTSSTQNIMTDINVRLISLAHVVGDGIPENEIGKQQLEEYRGSATFRRSKIHAGFAAAYETVKHRLRQLTRLLRREKSRPIFLTGHSLGGALATLSSLDLLLSENIPGKQLVVSSFGSPKVGNRVFQELYDSLIPAHWRVVAGGDLISRIPKIGYRHVGKKVYLSSSGELFIDPSALEMIFWHSQGASIVHHRKACYMLALKAWCDTLGDDYVPNFWPFPVSQNDSRKFDSTFRRPNSQPFTPRTWRRRQKGNRDSRLQGFAEAIDALDDNVIYSDSAINLWTHFVVKALEIEPHASATEAQV